MIVVTLTYPEVWIGALAGVMRRIQNMKLGTKREYGQNEGGWQADIMSCLGEMALAKHLDRFWGGAIGNYRAADVGKNFYQVRGTEWQNGRLLLHPKDGDNVPHTLARVKDRTVTLVGWAWGHEGKTRNISKPCRSIPTGLVTLYRTKSCTTWRTFHRSQHDHGALFHLGARAWQRP